MIGDRGRVNISKEEGGTQCCLWAFDLSNWTEGINSKKMSSDLGMFISK